MYRNRIISLLLQWISKSFPPLLLTNREMKKKKKKKQNEPENKHKKCKVQKTHLIEIFTSDIVSRK